ncbi:MAG TPA: alpha-E domain-containing protein [Candidatus Eisenbacteria bacterium]|nr:alpha-E domain-containing protein [Candidatus Eisenbacteria bacterium]
MLSRIADALYWMARYLERVDDTARAIQTDLLDLLDADGEAAGGRPPLLTPERTSPSALRSSLRLARDNARVARDRISDDMWETLHELWLHADPLLAHPDAGDRMEPFCRFVRNEVARFHGVASGTMPRGEAFGFYELGTSVERADMTARILDMEHHLVSPRDDGGDSAMDYYQWTALLRALSGFDTYRRSHHAGLEPGAVIDFLVLSPEFPRSLRFSVEATAHALDAIGSVPSARATLAAAATLRAAVVQLPRTDGGNGVLHEFLRGLVAHVAAFDRALCEEFFQSTSGDVACAT